MAHRSMPLPVLFATLALVLCTLLAVTVVSIEIAAADTFRFGIESEQNPLVLAGFLALLFSLMGGITAVVFRRAAQRDELRATRHN